MRGTFLSGVLPRPKWATLTLVAAVAYAPLTLFVGQGPLLTRGYRLLGYVLVASLILALIASVVALLPVRPATAWFAVASGWLVVSAGASLADDYGPVATLGLVALLMTVILLLDKSRFLDTLMVAATVYMVLAPLMPLADGRSPGVVEATPGYLPVAGAIDVSVGTPDVWFLVLDGYPSGVSRRQDFGAIQDPLVDELTASGFAVQPDALAPYTRTVGALPSILAGSMVFPPGSVQDTADVLAAGEVVGGDSTLVRGLRDVGYHTTMVESGWHLSACGPFVDSCVKSALVDEMGSALMSASLIPELFDIDRHVSSVVGTEHTFESLARLSEEYGDNARPDLVVAHSLAPHPPMLLDSGCQRQGPDPSRSSLLLSFDGWSDELIAERARTFMDQVACVDSLTNKFVQALPDDDVVVVVGDHGTEVRGQVSKIPSDWTEEMLRERLTTLAAVRFPGCHTEVRATIEVVPTLLRCFGLEVESPPLTAVIMANVTQEDGSEYPLVALESDQVERLLP